jgi:peptide/nickel transport system substrate-binding protein
MRRSLYKFTLALLLSILIFGMASQGVEDSSGKILKIGTPNVVKSASILGDSNMGVFAHLSNPTLMKMAADGKVVGLTAKAMRSQKMEQSGSSPSMTTCTGATAKS